MQKLDSLVLYSATDLVNFLECEHLTTLDLIDLEAPLPRTEDSEQAKLIQDKGRAHEARYLEVLRSRHATIVDIAQAARDLKDRAAASERAMRAGVEIIYQATLIDGPLVGHADFLRRVPHPSRLGDYGYEVLDTKLALSTKAKFIIQLAFYSTLVARVQGAAPQRMYVVLGDGTEAAFRFADFGRYFDNLLTRFNVRTREGGTATYPDPCTHCSICRWRDLCEARRERDDHLCQVANITKVQIKKFQNAGIGTLEALALSPATTQVAKMAPETLAKLRQQAALQLKARQTNSLHYDVLPRDPDGLRGFARLPRPDLGDMFFDMEGDPLEDGGLEYLFGVYFLEDGAPRFKPVWAHSRREECAAFEQFMDFVTLRLKENPGAHIYHYAHYEATALKRLMSLHGTREAEVDNLLRARKLIDLYKVVREALRISEPAYSLKNVERFYFEGRAGEVRDAGASIVFYERWRQTGDETLLNDIERYNRDDVRSTYELREWLVRLRPKGMPWAKERDAEEEAAIQVGTLTEAELALVPYRQRLLDPLPADRAIWGEQEHLDELTYQLLDFHRRADKPAWWAAFSRMEMTEEELLEDPECLAGLKPDPDNPRRADKRSFVYTYLFPEQETKLKTGDSAVRVDTMEPLRELTVDETDRRVTFKLAANRSALPPRLSIGPGLPIKTKVLQDALFRYADSRIARDSRYAAIDQFMSRRPPRIAGHEPDAPIIDETRESMPEIIRAIANLDRSYIFVQGPPGSGKTHTGAHVIAALLKRGMRVGVSSNSHKAINNLLRKVEEVAAAEGIRFLGAKKSSNGKSDSLFEGELIADVLSNEDIIAVKYQLIAGTAWLFADPALDHTLDFLFVDEAGQVSLANLVAMGTSARNLVLLGDQMQLGQPIQGVHPGRSGESALEYLLDGMATIAPERGIFLKTSWRMHPDVCRFISEAVYDGRLESEAENKVQRLLLETGAYRTLRPTGVLFQPIEHDARSQTSEEEAELARGLYDSLLVQRYCDKHGAERPMTLDNILVMAPYNAQVNLLKRVLPSGARVGTVDKFQGQEAEAVIVSMTTSSGEYLPRNLGFLYSKNRLNVAISRAKCLAVVIANPALLSIKCETPEEMALVNTLCWVWDYSVSESTN